MGLLKYKILHFTNITQITFQYKNNKQAGEKLSRNCTRNIKENSGTAKHPVGRESIGP